MYAELNKIYNIINIPGTTEYYFNFKIKFLFKYL